MISKLYQLTFEQLSEVESALIDIWLRDTTKPEERKAIVAAVASCILVCDLVAIVTAAQDKFAGGGGGDTKPRSVVSGCLSHKNSRKKESLMLDGCDFYLAPKIPEKKSSISEVYEALGKRIHTMLYSMDEITLDEEQWADSYDLHINHRNSRTSNSTMRGKS